MKTQTSKQITELGRIANNIAVLEKVRNNMKTVWTKPRRSSSHCLSLLVLGGLLLLPSAFGWSQCCIGPQYPDFHKPTTSQDGGSGDPHVITFDNFTPYSTTGVTHVNWWGSYENSEPGEVTGFTVDFWSSDGNSPGSLLASFATPGNAGETFVRIDDLGDRTYQYGLDVNFTAVAGVEYWMSIVADLDSPAQWGWESSSQGDGQAYQCLQGTCVSLQSDMAFSFGSSTTPEPSSLLLFGSGIVSLAGVLRRRWVR